MIPEKYAVYPDDEADHVVHQQQQQPQQEDIGLQGLRLLLDTEALKKDGPASINIIFGIASNRIKGSLSLHATGSTHNQCEEVIAILGKTLAPLIESKMIPCYGLGDQTTQDKNVFSFHMDHSPCHGFEEVLSCFRKMLPNMHFAGPAYYASVVEAAINIVEKSGGKFHTLFIITDDQVSSGINLSAEEQSPQEKQTIESIVHASSYPLSIVVVGVGDGPWEDMQKFKEKIPAREFDNFEFINFTELMSKMTTSSKNETAFATAAQMAITTQYKKAINLGLLGKREATAAAEGIGNTFSKSASERVYLMDLLFPTLRLSTAPETERIPDDVVEDILVRLPTKPLVRLRGLSSSWSSKIANPIFISKHLNLNNNNNNGFLLCKSPGGGELCIVVCNSDGSLTEISRFGFPYRYGIFIGFCNGIFCYTLRQQFRPRGGSPQICLWNPSIRKSKILVAEDERFYATDYGLAFHSQNNDFKLLRFGRFIKDGVPSCEGLLAQVYTLSKNSWRWLELWDISITRIETSSCLFFNGALHYIAYSQNRKLILCFDVHDHNFREIILPQDSNGLYPAFERLAVFKGSLALIAFRQDEDEIEVCCIWAMREYGLVDSWTQTNVVPLPDVEGFFGCTGSGQLVITKSPNHLFSFDPDSQNENNLGIEDLVPLVYTPNLIESLVLLNE